MKFPRYILALLILSAAIFLSACSGSVGNTSWPGVAVDDATAYVAYGTQLHAVNLETGTQKWVYPAKVDNTKTFYTPPVITPDGQLIVPSYNHKLYSLDPATGADKWVFEKAIDLYVTTPLVTEDAIYAPNADGKLYAVDLKGQLVWEFPTGQHLWATPAYDKSCGCLYQPSMDHYLYAINAASGSQIWKSEDMGGAMVAAPTLGPDGTLYIGTFKGEMLAVSSATGKVNWRFQAGGWVFSSAVLDGENLVFGDSKGNLYKLNASTGSQVWTAVVSNGTDPSSIISTPVIHEGVIYVSTKTGTIYAYSTDGTPSWNKTFTAKVYAPILVAGSNLLVAVNDAKAPLQAITFSSADVWTFSLDK